MVLLLGGNVWALPRQGMAEHIPHAYIYCIMDVQICLKQRKDIYMEKLEQEDNVKGPGITRVSIVIVGCNQPARTKLCIESLYKYTSHIDFELITVNNGSADGTAQYFDSLENTKKIDLKQYVGSAKAFNEGLQLAEGEFTVITQSNVIFTHSWLDNLMACVSSDESIGMAVPACNMNYDGQQVPLRYENLEEMYETAHSYNTGNPGKWEERLKLSLYTVLARTELLKELGGFAVAYSNYGLEQADLCFRLRRKGFRLIFAGDTYIHHFGPGNYGDEFISPASMEADSKVFSNRFGVEAAADTKIDFRAAGLVNCDGLRSMKLLAIGSTCGGTILQVKNLLRSKGIDDAELWYLTEDDRYIADLRTVCGNVSCATVAEFLASHEGEEFDCILLDKEIQLFENPEVLLKNIRSILKNNGQLLFTLSNRMYYANISDTINIKSGLAENQVTGRYLDHAELAKFLGRCNYKDVTQYYIAADIPADHDKLIDGIKALSALENKNELDTLLRTSKIIFNATLKKDLKTVLLYPGYDFWLNDGFFDLNVIRDQLGVEVGDSAFALLKKELAERGYDFRTIDKGDPEDAECIMFIDVPKSDVNPFYRHIYQWLHKGKKYLDLCLRIKRKKAAGLILFMQEPRFVMPENYDESVLECFDAVFTFDDGMVDNKKYFKYLVSEPAGVVNPYAKSFGDKKLLTLIDSNKSSSVPGELYSKRKEAIEYFEANHTEDFEFYGHGWASRGYKSYKGSVKGKLEAMSQYKFCICYENGELEGWVSEKIFDCFFSGCVPIYLGALNITNYIPADTFIDMRSFKDYEELYAHISAMGEEEYEAYLEHARAFLESDGFKIFSHEHFVESVVKVIEELVNGAADGK